MKSKLLILPLNKRQQGQEVKQEAAKIGKVNGDGCAFSHRCLSRDKDGRARRRRGRQGTIVLCVSGSDAAVIRKTVRWLEC